jgi:signal transduction histidine kinase
MPIEGLFTTDAQRHTARLARAIAPAAARLERACRTLLERCGYDKPLQRAFLAISPAGFARKRSLPRFLEEVEYQGRRLAKYNLSLGEVRSVLREMEALLDEVLVERFGPPREQVHLAAVLALDRAFCAVREAEAQALFGIYRAEAEAKDGEKMLRRVAAVLARTFGAGAAQVIEAAASDHRLRQPRFITRGTASEALIADDTMRRRFRSFWSHPLGPSAVVQLGFPVAYPWLPRERILLEIADGRCRGALERVALETEVRRLEAQARSAEEEERRRIGRELHDETGQSLLLLRLQLEMMEKETSGPLASRLKEAREGVERSVVELRRLIAALSPTALERLGVTAAIRHLVGRFRKSHPASVRLRIQGVAASIPRQIQDVIYRAVQECLQNISRHSQATAVNLSLTAADQVIRLRVADNGNGFRHGAAALKPASFGLEGLRARAALAGGRVKVEAAPGKGTMVLLEIPRNAAMVDRYVKDSRVSD